MITKTILFTLCCFNSFYSFSQPALITCSRQNNPDRSVSIYANSLASAPYTVKLFFVTLNGYTSSMINSSNVALVTVNRGNAEIIRLKPENAAMSYAIQYRYQYFPGKAFIKSPDNSLEYLLPASAGNQLRVTQISSTVSPISQQLKAEYRGTGFAYKLGDTICATRAGTVYECSDTAMVGEKTETVYRRGRNRIQIEQRDGTLGIYGISAPIKLLVSAGDEVFPGQPLAVFNKETEKYRLYFSVCYLDEKKVSADNSPDNSVYYIYIPTQFYGSEEERSTLLQANKEYTAQHPKDIIAAEMSKREKKKLGF